MPRDGKTSKMSKYVQNRSVIVESNSIVIIFGNINLKQVSLRPENNFKFALTCDPHAYDLYT